MKYLAVLYLTNLLPWFLKPPYVMDRWHPCTADAAPIVESTVIYEVHCNVTKIIGLKRDWEDAWYYLLLGI